MAAKSPKIAEELFYELRKEILSGRLAPGVRLPPERKLAAAYGTNRNTLREAIRRLEQAGLVTVRHGQGVTVSDFRVSGTLDLMEPFLIHGVDPEEKARVVTDLLATRTQVLEYAMELAITRGSDADLEGLAAIADELLALWESKDRVAIAQTYLRWLDALVDASASLPARWIANPVIEMNERLLERFPGMWVLDDDFPNYVREVTRAIMARDRASAASRSRAYYDHVDARILSVLGWAIQSGMAALDALPDELDAGEMRRRRDARRAAQKRRKQTRDVVVAATQNATDETEGGDDDAAE